MKFEVTITRIQVAKHYVTATDQEAAAEKIKEQLDARPYSVHVNFETVGTDIDVPASRRSTSSSPCRSTTKVPFSSPWSTRHGSLASVTTSWASWPPRAASSRSR